MSKSVGKIFGTGSTKNYGYENNYIDYLKNYNTSNYDNTINNMNSSALDMSANLSSMPEQQFAVSASDEARQRAENATYQAYIDKLNPEFARQTSDLASRLANKGISVGSEAYQRAMGDLVEKQNESLNQAAYQSVLNGQNAYSASLSDSLHTADFNNKARNDYINQIYNLLRGSVSGYENAANLYNTQAGIAARKTAAEQSGWNNLFKTISTVAPLYSKGAKEQETK